MWEVCYDKQMLYSWNPDFENCTAQIFGATNFDVITFFVCVCVWGGGYGFDRYNFPLEVVINMVVTDVLIVSCVDAFKTNYQSSYLHRASIVSKTLFIVPTDARYYKIIEMLRQYKNYNTCSDMFWFTQEPSSGSSPVLS